MIVTDGQSVAEALAGEGWDLEPEGACRGEICVPLSAPDDLEATASQLGMAVVRDEATGLTALGPASLGGRALPTAAAPDLELPLAVGDGVWRLADQRGRRTVIVAWAPW